MRWVSPDDGLLNRFTLLLRDRRAVAAATLVLALLGAIPPLLSHLQPDPAWLLYVTGRVLDGARLYTDVVEVNPPLIIWLNVPAVAMARALDVPVPPMYTLWVTGILTAAAVGCGRLLRQLYPDDVDLQTWLGLLLVCALFPLAREDFGQREHLFFALALPYVLVTVLRVEGRSVPLRVALGVGAAAGLGIAIKPYFVLLWLSLEAATLRLGPRKVRPESLAILAVGVLYVASVAIWTPEYFELVRSMAGPYARFLSNSILTTAFVGDGAQLPIVVALAGLAFRGRVGRGRAWTVVSWAMVSLWLAAVLQQKGWRYHFYPALALSLFLAGWLAADAQLVLRSRIQRLYAAVCLAGTMLVLGASALGGVRQMLDPLNSRYDPDPDLNRLLPAVAADAAGRRVLVLSWSIASAYPLLPLAGTEGVSRFPSLWILGATYWDAVRNEAALNYHPPGAMTLLERQLSQSLLEDLRRYDPGLILVLRPGPDRRDWGLRRLDLLAYFRRDSRFAEYFGQFSYDRQIGEYWLFRRSTRDRRHVEPPRRPVVEEVAAAGLTGRVDPPSLRDVAGALGLLLLTALAYLRPHLIRLQASPLSNRVPPAEPHQ